MAGDGTLGGEGAVDIEADADTVVDAGQVVGANGLQVTSSGVVLEDFAVKNTPGDGIRVIGAEGPPHNTRFTVQVTLEDGTFAMATGSSKQEAQSLAAGELLTRMEEGEDPG